MSPAVWGVWGHRPAHRYPTVIWGKSWSGWGGYPHGWSASWGHYYAAESWDAGQYFSNMEWELER